jgi:hypothetical protein
MYSILNHTTTGRKANDFTSGEDTELCYWHILSGFKLWYCESLKLSHYMTQSRLEILNFKVQLEGMKKSSLLLNKLDILVEMYLKKKSGFFNYKYWILNLLKLNIKPVLREVKSYLIFKGILHNEIIVNSKKINKIYFKNIMLNSLVNH